MKFEEILPYLRKGRIAKKNGMFIKVKDRVMVYSYDSEFRDHLTGADVMFSGSYILEDYWELVPEKEDCKIRMVALNNNQYRIESVLDDDIIASINLKQRTIILFDKMLKEYDVEVIVENI